jgi:cysteine desulfurase/selenocysteine lyase
MTALSVDIARQETASAFSISGLDHDWSAYRAAFPTTRKFIYLDSARKALVPLWTEAAMAEWVRDVYDNAGGSSFSMDEIEEARGDVGALVGADPANIAFVKNTSEGVNIIAHGIDLRPGDNVVLSELEHENNTFPWRYLEAQGIEIRIIGASGDGRVLLDQYRAVIDSRTRVLSVAWVSYGAGHRSDTRKLAELAHGAGAILVIDAIQACGMIDQRLDSLGADAVFCGGHKTLLSLAGAGLMYVRSGLIEQIMPPYAAKFSFTSLDRAVPQLKLANDCHRFEYGNPNFVGIYCQRRSAQIIASVTLARIEARIRSLTDRLIGGLQKLQADVRTSAVWEERCGIVSIKPRGSAQQLEIKLKERGICTAEKDGLLRFSVYAYNNEEDIDGALSVLREL